MPIMKKRLSSAAALGQVAFARIVGSAASSMTTWPSVQVPVIAIPPLQTAAAMDKQVQRQKNSRKSAPKSRQGCITCKTRHVKCDETRPTCKRCAKAGRNCGGYAQEGDSPANEDAASTAGGSAATATESSAALVAPVSTVNIEAPYLPNSDVPQKYEFPPIADPAGLPIRINTSTMQEMRFLEYFYTRTAPSMSGFFDTHFYNRLLLQAGQYEPAIRHGMMAVGAMHEYFEFSVVPALEGRRQPVGANEKPAFALQQYNKAISGISKQLSAGPGSMESVLMCCLLFVCLECLRGDAPTASTHLKSGGEIIANLRKQQKLQHFPPGDPYAPNPQDGSTTYSNFIETYLVPIFDRLSIHVAAASKMTSSEIPPITNRDLRLDDPLIAGFKNIDDARKSIMDLGNLAAGFAKSVAQYKFVDEVTDEQVRSVTAVQRKLQLWEDTMNNFVQKNGISRRSVVLQVQHRIFKIVALTALAPEQSANDFLTSDFEIGVSLAEQLLDNSDSRIPAQEDEGDLQIFSLEEGVAPALFFFATRCRVPALRRRAIQTIWKGPRRQGIWNAVLFAKVAQRVVELEENYPRLNHKVDTLATAPAEPPIDPILEASIDPSLINLPMTPESISSPLNFDHEIPTSIPSAASASADTESVFFDLLPPEYARIHHADIKESTDGSPHQHAVTFLRKPHGLDREWDMWTELIYI